MQGKSKCQSSSSLEQNVEHIEWNMNRNGNRLHDSTVFLFLF